MGAKRRTSNPIIVLSTLPVFLAGCATSGCPEQWPISVLYHSATNKWEVSQWAPDHDSSRELIFKSQLEDGTIVDGIHLDRKYEVAGTQRYDIERWPHSLAWNGRAYEFVFLGAEIARQDGANEGEIHVRAHHGESSPACNQSQSYVFQTDGILYDID